MWYWVGTILRELGNVSRVLIRLKPEGYVRVGLQLRWMGLARVLQFLTCCKLGGDFWGALDAFEDSEELDDFDEAMLGVRREVRADGARGSGAGGSFVERARARGLARGARRSTAYAGAADTNSAGLESDAGPDATHAESGRAKIY